jgi:rhamnulokinase
MEAAALEPGLACLVDPDDPSFLYPDDMTVAIDNFCRKTDQPVPGTPAAYARAILDSLALKYRLVIRDLESLTGRTIENIRVIGGGSRNRLLNQCTADATGKRVIAGPSEATALGNIAIQMIATGAVASLAEARGVIDRSFPTDTFNPQDPARWSRQAARFQHYCELAYA